MLVLNSYAEVAGLERAAEHLCVAARTAPKGKGQDLLAEGNLGLMPATSTMLLWLS